MGAVDRSVPVYPIGIVQNLTGLTGRQIRYYEQQGLLTPERTKGNQRLYSPEDVDQLMRIKELLAQGLTLEGVRQHLASSVQPTSAPTETEAGPPAAHERDLLTRYQAGGKLASLYPVNNQAALVHLLETRRAAKERQSEGD
jgi:MerR family glutamine synthetase transcriptional repressor